jgi:hypothetical protein
MINDLGDSKVTIRKDELLLVMRSNRAKHREEFQEADLKYRVAVITALQARLIEVQDGADIRLDFKLPKPESHDKQYALVIRMLEMSVADEITITEHQFSQYVQDEWDWMRQFKAVTANYGGRT